LRKVLRGVRLKNFLRRFATYHYVVEVKLKDFYATYRSKFIPVDPKQDSLFKDQQKSQPEVVFESELRELIQTASSNQVKTVLLYTPTLQDPALKSESFDNIRSIKQRLAREWNVPLVDLTTDLQTASKSYYLEADPVHLNHAGNQIVARRLLEVVKDFFNKP